MNPISFIAGWGASTATGIAGAFSSILVSEATQLANRANPNTLPPPSTLIGLRQCGLITDAKVSEYMRLWGIPYKYDSGQPPAWQQQTYFNHVELWNAVEEFTLPRPDPGTVAQLKEQGRLAPSVERDLKFAVPAAWERWADAVRSACRTPSDGELLQLHRLGHITPGVFRSGMRANGWYKDKPLEIMQQAGNLPGIIDLTLAGWRGYPDEGALHRYRQAAGWVDPVAADIWALGNRPMPGPSDLVRFAVREAWDEETAAAWGYDEEFPAPFKAWMQWWGQDWGEQLPDGQGGQIPRVPWPLAYWRAHWQIISPQQAYRAIHLLRPDRIGRYQQIAPGVTPFTHDDLRRVLKVSDYPPKMRAWLAAISYLPLRLTDIRTAFVNHIRDRQWAIDQLLDRGYVHEDAVSVVETWARAPEDAIRKALLAYQVRAVRETIAETRAAYRMGGIADTVASARLIQIGLNLPTVQRILALEDARAAREQLTQFIRQLRRSYLAGALSDAEALASLQAAQIAPPAQQRYLRLWTAELTAERKSLSTAQVTAAVAAGEIPPAIAALRLGRLGWTQPDAALLIQRAVAQLTRAQARAAAQALSAAQRQQRSLLAAQRQAQAAARSAQRQLRSIYPLGALKRQYCLGIRKASTIQALLLSQGYTQDAISALLLQWARECEASPPAPDKRVGSLESYLRRQTPISLLKQWWQNGITTDKWTRARLATIGVEQGAISPTVELWGRTLGKKSGPAPEGTPPPSPLS